MKVCAICNKGSVIGGRRAFLRSHYNPVGKIRKYPNLQWARLAPEAASGKGRTRGRRVKVCVNCMRSLHR